jgi:hypothetical protein
MLPLVDRLVDRRLDADAASDETGTLLRISGNDRQASERLRPRAPGIEN